MLILPSPPCPHCPGVWAIRDTRAMQAPVLGQRSAASLLDSDRDSCQTRSQEHRRVDEESIHALQIPSAPDDNRRRLCRWSDFAHRNLLDVGAGARALQPPADRARALGRRRTRRSARRRSQGARRTARSGGLRGRHQHGVGGRRCIRHRRDHRRDGGAAIAGRPRRHHQRRAAAQGKDDPPEGRGRHQPDHTRNRCEGWQSRASIRSGFGSRTRGVPAESGEHQGIRRLRPVADPLPGRGDRSCKWRNGGPAQRRSRPRDARKPRHSGGHRPGESGRTAARRRNGRPQHPRWTSAGSCAGTSSLP